METIDHYINQAKAKRDAGALKISQLEFLRDNSIKKLEEMSIPNRKVENWKYTNLKTILSQNYCFDKIDNTTLTANDHKDFINLYFINGVFNESLSEDVDLKITSLMNSTNTEAIEYLSKEHFFTEDFSNVLNMAYIQKGNVIEISENQTLEKPVLIHQIFTGDLHHHSISNVYITNNNAHMTILETITSTDNVFVNYSSHSLVKRDASFNHTMIQDTLSGSLITMNVNSEILKNGLYKNVMIQTGAKTSRTNLYLELSEEHAQSEADGLYALHKDQHHDTMSYTHHKAPQTYSKQLYKGILGDESRGIFTGRVRVEREAQLTDAKQLNKNLLLTKKAHANSRPQLEIYADDVKCAHGSTTGQLSEDELFYFESRGINKEKARTILARAFAYDVVLNINNLKVRDFTKAHLLNKNIVR
jgi:Fe-S cluster assembly protein SufD